MSNETIEEIKAEEPIVAEQKPKRKYNKKVKTIVEPDVIPAEIVEEIKEPEPEPETIIPVIVKEEKQKVKKPRSPAQLAAFEKARLKRLENIGKIVTEVKEKMADTTFENKVVEKAITIKKKQHRAKKLLEEVVYDEQAPPQPVFHKPTFVFA